MELVEFKSLIDTGINDDVRHVAEKWLERGDGVAVYENVALDSVLQLGHRIFLSFGSPAAQLEMDEPPQRCPDISGRLIGWKYQLAGVVRAEKKDG